MPELRKDPVIGRWVIIASDRSKRPSDFAFHRPPAEEKFCPFCEGNEDKTPPEIISYRQLGTVPNSPGWWLRVVPNKFPALQYEGDLDRTGEGMYDKMNGVGAHEVFIETPNHTGSYATHSEKQIQEIFWAFRERIVGLKKDRRIRYVMIFKNHGKEAGASLNHPHSQLIAIPTVPKRVQEEMAGAKLYYDFKERCVFCDMVRQEITSNCRVVEENHGFLSFEPFASRFPFETWIVPKRHECNFENTLKEEMAELANIIKNTFTKIKTVLNDPPYNLVVHTGACKDGDLEHYHWHIEIIPKITNVAGFEWGTGFYINPTPPETAAAYLNSEEEVFVSENGMISEK